jgi:hypothetical protein
VLEVPPHILEYLDEQPTLTSATTSAVGVPRATTLTYVNEELGLYVWTRPETTTARHIQENAVVATAPTPLFAMERDAFRGLVAQSMGTRRDFDRLIQQRLEDIRVGVGGWDG